MSNNVITADKFQLAAFIEHYWQKQPLLIKGLYNKDVFPLQPDDIIQLATANSSENDSADSTGVESKFISSKVLHANQTSDAWEFTDWQLQRGPFEVSKKVSTLSKKPTRLKKGKTQLPKLPSFEESGWTVLVQNCDLYFPELQNLLKPFYGLPYARFDDVMVSLASLGGGVGPHTDSYDVFLVQGMGQRRWRIGSAEQPIWQEGLPLKILSNFSYTQEWVLDVGDVLYLPPHYAHEGVALSSPCMTYSLGFRSPTVREMLMHSLEYLQDSLEQANHPDLDSIYQDSDSIATQHPAQCPSGLTEFLEKHAKQHLQLSKDDARLIATRWASEQHPPKNISDEHVLDISAKAFQKLANQLGFSLHSACRMAYEDTLFFIDGQQLLIEESAADKTELFAIWQRLADHRQMTFHECQQVLTKEFWQDLYELYQLGYVLLPKT